MQVVHRLLQDPDIKVGQEVEALEQLVVHQEVAPLQLNMAE
jgi:hypothetical protein